MTLGSQALSALEEMKSFTDERRELTVQSDRWAIRAEVLAADRLSCSLGEIRLESRRPAKLSAEDLRAWGQRISQRVHYMLEAIEPVEIDAGQGQLLLRSTPPEKKKGSTFYYELLLESSGRLCFSRRRFDTHARSRSAEPLHCTRELFEKLIDDLAATAPA